MITAGPDGSLYVLDSGNRQVQRFSAAGEYETHWAFRQGDTALRELDGLAVDGSGNVYISDASTGRIHQITPDSRIARSFRYEARQGEETDALLDLGVDGEGCLYAARRGGHLIRKFSPAGELLDTIETYAPLVQMVVDNCGPAAAAEGAVAAGPQGVAASQA
jgi:serine/threonine-protein kinase